jgi:hypothetical protein
VTDTRHIILTGRDGELDGTSPQEVAETIEHARAQPEVIIHFHGGLVDEARGLTTAQRLTQVYREAGAYSVFLVWRSGLLKVLKHNLDEIAHEELFKRLLGRVLQFCGEVVAGRGGTRC